MFTAYLISVAGRLYKCLWCPKRFNMMIWLWIMASVFIADAAEDQNLQHPEYCDMFYSVGICPPGEHFDANEGVCNLPQLANCHIAGGSRLDPRSAPSEVLVASFPHPNSCEKYYRINICPPNFNFNPASNACDYPKHKGCPSNNAGCPTLDQPPGVEMKPLRCANGDNKVGDVCRFGCKKPLQPVGSTFLTCKGSGWESEGAYTTPTCVQPVAVVQAFIADMVKELEHIDGGILFVVDESGSLTAKNFETEKVFIMGVIARLPLSVNRSAGVILFSDKSRVEVSVKTKDSCSFYKQVAAMKYGGGGTNIRLALETAKQELQTVHHNKKAVVLLTDGQSPNATEIAEELKHSGIRIFTIGVTGHDEEALSSMASVNEDDKPLFYAVSTQQAFNSIVNYLKTAYITKVPDDCIPEAYKKLVDLPKST